MRVDRRIILGGMGALVMRPGFSATISEENEETSANSLTDQLYDLVNSARRKSGRSKLKRNPKLERAAAKFAAELDRRKYGVGRGRVAFKAHGANAANEVKQRARRQGYKVKRIGENVGYY